MLKANNVIQTTVLTIIASSVSAIIVGGLTGWFTLQSMEKQSDTAQLAACYNFNAERAMSALRELEKMSQLRTQLVLAIYKNDRKLKREDLTETVLKIQKSLRSLELYTSDSMVSEIKKSLESSNKLVVALGANNEKKIAAFMDGSQNPWANLRNALRQEMLLLRDPAAQCK